ncbi:MAG: molybdopterin-binding protein [bacterium]|nr:molybdopterin-binding protein [bacterium]
MTEFLRLKTIDEVKEIYDKCFSDFTLGKEVVSINHALGRILARDVVSEVDLPTFPRSTMDGFAVRSQDTYSAREGSPIYLKVIGEIKMGEEARLSLRSGEAIKISTGGMIPKDGDAVVMIENTEYIDDKLIEVKRSVANFENIIRIGEDVKKGDLILKKGEVIKPQYIGVLAGIGVISVEVYKRIKVSIIPTGDEIVDIDIEPKLGEVRDINSYLLSNLIKEYGGEVTYSGIIKDDFAKLKEAVLNGVEASDIVLISGGSSVGTRDKTLDVVSSLGEVLVHGIHIRPGKPTLIGKINNKPVFGLPGHPASTMVVFITIVRPLLDKIQDIERRDKIIHARMKRNIPSPIGREDYIRVILEKRNGEYLASPLFGKSGLIMPMVVADGLVKIGKDTEGLDEGEMVEVIPL